jgi:hypothetical protein
VTPTPGVVSFGHKWNLEVPGLAGSEGDEGPAVVRDRAQTLRQLAHAMEVQRQRSVGGESTLKVVSQLNRRDKRHKTVLTPPRYATPDSRPDSRPRPAPGPQRLPG